MAGNDPHHALYMGHLRGCTIEVSCLFGGSAVFRVYSWDTGVHDLYTYQKHKASKAQITELTTAATPTIFRSVPVHNLISQNHQILTCGHIGFLGQSSA